MLYMKELKISYSKILPVKGYHAITLFDHMIIRNEFKDIPVKRQYVNHESIHAAQARDFGIGFCGYFIFYLWYLIEWIFKLPSWLFGGKPYYSVSFEQEAYNREFDYDYLDKRKRFEWIKYVFKIIKKR